MTNRPPIFDRPWTLDDVIGYAILVTVCGIWWPALSLGAWSLIRWIASMF